MAGLRIFVAGATGAIGLPLCRLLIADGHQVTGATRRAEKAGLLEDMGVIPAVVDMYDADRLGGIMREARPDVVMHQLTDLPPGLDPALMAEGRQRNARLREVGTSNLVAAAVAAGASRMIAQSIAFAYAAGQAAPLAEDAALDAQQTAVASLERQVLSAPLVGIVLRYGRLYGPGTGFSDAAGAAPVHVDAAAEAARLALNGPAGIYNATEEDGTVDSSRARTLLGWNPEFRA